MNQAKAKRFLLHYLSAYLKINYQLIITRQEDEEEKQEKEQEQEESDAICQVTYVIIADPVM